MSSWRLVVADAAAGGGGSWRRRIYSTRTDPPVTAVPVQLTEKCMVLVLAMYGGARRMHAVHASPLV